MSTMARLEADRLVSAGGRGRTPHGQYRLGRAWAKTTRFASSSAALACEGHVAVRGTCREPRRRFLARANCRLDRGRAVSRASSGTPDLQPTDVTGLAIFDQKQRDFEFRPGPVFAHVLLVDEINRAMPKTPVGAARGDGRGPGDGRRRDAEAARAVHPCSRPRTRSSTKGTFPLPEAQLDRFFLRTSLGYPGEDDELQIIPRSGRGPPPEASADGHHATPR